MKKEKSVSGTTGLKVLMLAMGIMSPPQSSSASAFQGSISPADALPAKVETPPTLGGISLLRPQPWQPVSAYRIGMVLGSYGPADQENGSSTVEHDAGIDPIKTAAIIPGVF